MVTRTVLSYQSVTACCHASVPSMRAPGTAEQVTDPILTATQIDVATANQQSTILVGEGLGEQLAPLLDRHGVGRKRFVVSSPVIWRHQGARIQARRPRRADPHPRRRALQDAGLGVAHLRRAHQGRRRPRQRRHGRRRRRHRRHRRLCRRQLPARHHAGARADDAAGAGGQLDRRQGRRQPCARQEPDRRLPPAGARGGRPAAAWPRCRGASSARDSTRW